MTAALYGGSFDPPHIGHEAIAKIALESLDIQTLFITPSYLNPFKKKFHFTPKQRYELLQELFDDNLKISICDFEIKQNEPTPSIKTVNYLIQKYNIKKLYLIIGADNLSTLHLWDSFDSLKQIVHFVVITRDGYEVKDGIIPFKVINLQKDISSSKIRESLDDHHIPNKIKQKVKELWKKELKE